MSKGAKTQDKSCISVAILRFATNLTIPRLLDYFWNFSYIDRSRFFQSKYNLTNLWSLVAFFRWININLNLQIHLCSSGSQISNDWRFPKRCSTSKLKVKCTKVPILGAKLSEKLISNKSNMNPAIELKFSAVVYQVSAPNWPKCCCYTCGNY